MHDIEESENRNGPFSFELDINAPVAFTHIGEDIGSLSSIGRVRISGFKSVRVGGSEDESINLGFKLYDEFLKQIFEDRAVIENEMIMPNIWHDFRIRIPNKAEICNAKYIELNFVSEGRFWFQNDRGAILNSKVLFNSHTRANEELSPGETGFVTVSSGLSGPESFAAESDIGRFVFDISDLIQFWKDNVRPIGIQRVQIEVLKSILEQKISNKNRSWPFVIVTYDINAHNWVCLSLDMLENQINLSSRADISKTSWTESRGKLLKSAKYYAPAAADMLINIGSSWWIPDYLHKIQLLKNESRIKYVPFIHDVIPLVTPEFCDANLVEEFQLWFRGAVATADAIVVNSSASEADVRRYAMSLTGTCPDISIARLNAVFPRTLAAARSGIRERYNLDIERYVLCVGTLEARKNHAMLLQVWAELSQIVPRERQARLVLVGKEGWMFEAAQAALKRYPALKKSVLFLNNLSDQELDELYRHCLFTVYPSFYEGWGLPVTEAVSYGKLTVASSSSSIPEAASPGDILLDPRDSSAWRDTLARLLVEDEFLVARTQTSRTQGRLRGWPDVADDILAAALDSPLRSAERLAPVAQDGTIYDFRMVTARKNFGCSAMPFRAGSGWHHCEDWGAWSAPGVTELRFRFADAADRFCYLVLQGASESVEFTLTVDRELRVQRRLEAGERSILRLVAQNLIDLGARTNGADRRQIGVGFVSFCIAPCGDVVSRLNFNEAMGMQFC